MNVLLLTNNPENAFPVVEFLRGQGENVVLYGERITPLFLDEIAIDFVISFGYRYLIRQDVISHMTGRIINLHISLLPYNRGADPNIWSFLDNTPKGVTIHAIDAGLDTGGIYAQKELTFDEDTETLASTYAQLQTAMRDLLEKYWDVIRSGQLVPKPQIGVGTSHKSSDFAPFRPLLEPEGFAIPIRELKRRYAAACERGNNE